MNERRPVVFIHGLWLHASSWSQWLSLFEAHGYNAVAPGWPGEAPTAQAERARPRSQSGGGISELREHYERTAGACAAQPVLVGHGLGGWLALTLATGIHAAGIVAVDAAPPGATAPIRPAGIRTRLGAAMLSQYEFRQVYGSALSRAESDRLYERWAIPAPWWAMNETGTQHTPARRSALPTTNSSHSPTLLMASGVARLQSAAARDADDQPHLLADGSDVRVFPDRGPSLIIDSGWRLVADACLSWMDAYEL
jgi:non-heme chloroperoxidase